MTPITTTTSRRGYASGSSLPVLDPSAPSSTTALVPPVHSIHFPQLSTFSNTTPSHLHGYPTQILSNRLSQRHASSGLALPQLISQADRRNQRRTGSSQRHGRFMNITCRTMTGGGFLLQQLSRRWACFCLSFFLFLPVVVVLFAGASDDTPTDGFVTSRIER